MQVQPNITFDQSLLVEALPQLTAGMGLHTLLTDGGHIGSTAAEVCSMPVASYMPSKTRDAKGNAYSSLYKE
jgi:hypothetical protein